MKKKQYVKLFEEFSRENDKQIMRPVSKRGSLKVYGCRSTWVQIDEEEQRVLRTLSVTLHKTRGDRRDSNNNLINGMEEDLGMYFEDMFQEPDIFDLLLNDSQYLMMYVKLENNITQSEIKIIENLEEAKEVETPETKKLTLYVFSKNEIELMNKEMSRPSIWIESETIHDEEEFFTIESNLTKSQSSLNIVIDN